MTLNETELLSEIDKKLAVVITDMDYMKKGHEENRKRIARIEIVTEETNRRLVEGAGKIKRNWTKVVEVDTKLRECQLKRDTDTKDAKRERIGFFDVVLTFLMLIVMALQLYKGP